ncbi:sugar phosphate isomerase/epimerase family protein [Lederbergia citrea]|uniref:TIM barrel protein n=1 Tax=Lederbergia citrea TaxID=2833581 RepID=A0A942Z3F4_9BACI|nr:TIM barrel protein [Lederbergia citrea]
MKLSIGGYSFFNTIREGKMDIFGYLETVRYRYGLDKVDFWNGQFSLDFSTVPEESYVQKVREAMDEKGMTLVNYAVDGAHIWDADPEERERLYERALGHLKVAEILGAKTVRIDTGGVFGNNPEFDMNMSDEQFEYIVKRYREFSKRGANNGYMVGPENHIGPSLSPVQMKKIAEAVDHPNYGILLHIGRWKEEADKGDEMVAPWVYHTHFDASTAVAEDAEEKISMLLENGFDGYWGIEYNADKNQYTEIEWIIGTVKRLLVNLKL